MLNYLKPFKTLLINMLVGMLFFLIGCDGGRGEKISPTKIAEYNKPAVVYIQVFYQGKVSFPEIAVDENKLIYFASRRNYSTQKDAAEGLMNEILNNPGEYFLVNERNQTTQEVQFGFTGSGLVITPDGYIVTNAHVVYLSDEELVQGVVNQALNQQISQQIQKDFQDLTSNGVDLSEEQWNKLQQIYASIYQQYIRFLSKPSGQTYVDVGSAVPGIGNIQKGFAADIKKLGAVSPGKDIAILKITASNLPTVTLSKRRVNLQDKVIAMGFPGVAFGGGYLSQDQSNIVPTVTSGTISAFKKMITGGWEVYQHDAAIHGGNSGGPLFDEYGEVIGINTFGVNITQGFNYSIPTEIVEEFLNEINIKPQEGKLNGVYHDAVDLYYDDYYSAAADKFKEILDANSSFPFAQEFKEKCIAEVNAGNDNNRMFGGWRLFCLIIIFLMVILAVMYYYQKKTNTNILDKVFPKSKDISPKIIKEQKPADIKAPETPKSTSKKFCNQCGHQLNISDKFCSSCGAKVV